MRSPPVPCTRSRPSTTASGSFPMHAVPLWWKMHTDELMSAVVPSIPPTVDAQATIEGPFGFDNVISAEAARVKKPQSRV